MSVGALLMSRRRSAVFAALLLVLVTAWSARSAAGRVDRPTLIACHVPREFKYFAKPENCEIFARQYFPDGRLRRYRNVVARHLVWSHWGDSVAVGKGKFSSTLPLTLVAYDRVRCPDGRSYYGRVSIHGRPSGSKGIWNLRLVHCGAKEFGGFPE